MVDSGYKPIHTFPAIGLIEDNGSYFCVDFPRIGFQGVRLGWRRPLTQPRSLLVDLEPVLPSLT